MGLFDRQIRNINNFLAEKRRMGQIRELTVEGGADWPREATLVLEENIALELGNPGMGSLSFILWSKLKSRKKDRIILIGPDVREIKGSKGPFCQILRVSGSFREDYECYREIKDAVYALKLRGFMTRILPGQQVIWCRLNSEAIENGFSLRHLGAALIRDLKKIRSVSNVEVIFITSGREDLDKVRQAGDEAGRIARALVKMVEEKSFDCPDCDYQDICDKIEELKKIKKNLRKETSLR